MIIQTPPRPPTGAHEPDTLPGDGEHAWWAVPLTLLCCAGGWAALVWVLLR